MLVLSRHWDDSIIIDLSNVDLSLVANKVIEIVTVEIRGDKVRLGIEADPKIPIIRKELRRDGKHSG